jgi:signal transduction histidine kinase
MSVLKPVWWKTSFWRNQPDKIVTRYLLPISAVGTAVEINLLIAPYLSILPPFLTFLAAIMLTAWYGGFPSALFSIVLSGFALKYYFIPPIYVLSLNPADLGTLGFFTLEALAMAYCIDYLRRNENALRRTNLDLEQQVISKRQELSEKEERLQGLMHQLAATEERERRELAAELHDYLAQLLTLARMKIKLAQQNMHRSGTKSQRFVAETDDLLRTCTNYVRTLMAELYPAQLHEMGLPAAVRWLAGQMPKHGLAVDLSIGIDSLPIPDRTALLLYQSVRELLMNIVKHAEVNRAFISLDVASHCVFVTIQDNGRGFDTATSGPSISGQHLGLQTVKDRMATVGGTFSLESRLGKGTSVTLTVPLESGSQLRSTRAASGVCPDRSRPMPVEVQDQQSLPL